jgi:HK97 family phage major capsid protein
MPPPVTTSVWGQESWSSTLIEALSQESVVLRSGATRVVIEGRVGHVPRLLVDPDADWIAELAELPSNAGDADEVVLEPKKIANVVEMSRESVEDAPIDQLDAVGRAMVRGLAKKVDAKFFSTDVATAVAPAGLRSYTLPGVAGNPDTNGLLTAVGAIEAEGGSPDSIYISPADLTALRIAVVGGGYQMSDPTAPGVERIGGATLYPAPLPAGTAVVAEARFIALGIRRDATVDFSEDAAFSRDAVAARTTMRVDWEPGDPAAFYVIS